MSENYQIYFHYEDLPTQKLSTHQNYQDASQETDYSNQRSDSEQTQEDQIYIKNVQIGSLQNQQPKKKKSLYKKNFQQTSTVSLNLLHSNRKKNKEEIIEIPFTIIEEGILPEENEI
ncbi:hypothetical protein ABPG72_001886 [Tetrahymena utriculariae]